MQICVCDNCLWDHLVSNGAHVSLDVYAGLWIDAGNLCVLCGGLLSGVRISRHEVIFDLVTSSMEDFIEALVVIISAEYKKSIANLLELRGSIYALFR